jgi:hypothetical protein
MHAPELSQLDATSGVVAIYEDDNQSLNPAERFHAIKMRKIIDGNKKVSLNYS